MTNKIRLILRLLKGCSIEITIMLLCIGLYAQHIITLWVIFLVIWILAFGSTYIRSIKESKISNE
jgi:hypothetical protein